jgi:predicted nuclease of predicted toxin-antitoxin system
VKLLFDENLSPRLTASLADAYPGSQHVHEIGLGAAEDSAVWDYARQNGFAIVTKDSDFAERSVLAKGPPKIIWIRLGNCSTEDIETVLRSASKSVQAFLEEHGEVCLQLVRGYSHRRPSIP